MMLSNTVVVIRFRVKFEIILHEWVFKKAQSAGAEKIYREEVKTFLQT